MSKPDRFRVRESASPVCWQVYDFEAQKIVARFYDMPYAPAKQAANWYAEVLAKGPPYEQPLQPPDPREMTRRISANKSASIGHQRQCSDDCMCGIEVSVKLRRVDADPMDAHL